MTGFGYYAQLGCWVLGETGINGRPGYQNPPALRLDQRDPQLPPLGLQIVARFDAIDAHYASASRGGIASGIADGSYLAYAAEFGVNLWWTRHVRFSLDYAQYFFPNQHTGAGNATLDENHARGPHGGVGGFGELSARVGLAL